MASIEKRPRSDGQASGRAHYRRPSGEQRNKTFDRKADAERFLATVEASKNTTLPRHAHTVAEHGILAERPQHRFLTGAPPVKGPKSAQGTAWSASLWSSG